MLLMAPTAADKDFQSTSLSRGKTEPVQRAGRVTVLSIHFPLTREDCIYRHAAIWAFLSIHFPLTREDGHFAAVRRFHDLSIHFPLTREDCHPGRYHPPSLPFNPLPSHEGRRNMTLKNALALAFQSTSLSRGKTPTGGRWNLILPFNPLPSHEGRRDFESHKVVYDLSIHFPLTREDLIVHRYLRFFHTFQSTSLSRGKTVVLGDIVLPVFTFNPLPSHEGRPGPSAPACPEAPFNPLPSHEGRQKVLIQYTLLVVFQSTSLSRGKTPVYGLVLASGHLSIHFPLTREDSLVFIKEFFGRIFQSTSLSRGKTWCVSG